MYIYNKASVIKIILPRSIRGLQYSAVYLMLCDVDEQLLL